VMSGPCDYVYRFRRLCIVVVVVVGLVVVVVVVVVVGLVVVAIGRQRRVEAFDFSFVDSNQMNDNY